MTAPLSRRRFVTASLTAAGGLAIGITFKGAADACGIPNDPGPRVIADDDVPAALRAAPSSTTTTALHSIDAGIVVYLVSANRLVSAQRTLSTPVSPAIARCVSVVPS